MPDLFGNHIVGFPTRRLKCLPNDLNWLARFFIHVKINSPLTILRGTHYATWKHKERILDISVRRFFFICILNQKDRKYNFHCRHDIFSSCFKSNKTFLIIIIYQCQLYAKSCMMLVWTGLFVFLSDSRQYTQHAVISVISNSHPGWSQSASTALNLPCSALYIDKR